ncbi:hypothetical protein [Clostridium sp. AM58-1XD]|uniref:hypothetical protein n=1 Tax=Clostridium sp. AM58-1XD TaxID=2292307 RepID=UPI001FA91654|nr:hypothetical protein [Clostridium sp. AM58-1XD]
MIEKSNIVFQKVEEAIFAGFSQEEVELFAACLERMQNNLLNAVSQTEREE